MFGFLKKKIKDIVNKISEKVSEEHREEKPEKPIDEIKKEEIESKEALSEFTQKKIEDIEQKEINAIEKETSIKEENKEHIEIEKRESYLEEKKEYLDKEGVELKIKEDNKVHLDDTKEKFKEDIEALEVEKSSIKTEKKPKFKILRLEKEIKESDINKLENDIKISFLQADVAFEVVNKIYEDLRKELVGKVVKINESEKFIINSLKKIVLDILNQPSINIENIIEENRKKGKPTLILFLGFNGSGKTTTLAKIAYLLKSKGFSVVIAAADTFRAASIEQLEEHANKLNIKMIKHRYGADAAAVIYDAVEHAKANNIDVVLADTAGRSHTNINLMEELKKICRVNKPDLKILVLDALTGNDIINQCEIFNNAVGVDALILTKVDVYDKGGAILSATYTIKKPILFLGIGQNYEDIKVFNPEEILNNLFQDIE